MEKNATTERILDADELAQHIEALRAELKNLSSVVGRIADKELGRVQGLTTQAVNRVGEATKQNPVSALTIAVGLGFLSGILLRP